MSLSLYLQRNVCCVSRDTYRDICGRKRTRFGRERNVDNTRAPRTAIFPECIHVARRNVIIIISTKLILPFSCPQIKYYLSTNSDGAREGWKECLSLFCEEARVKTIEHLYIRVTGAFIYI